MKINDFGDRLRTARTAVGLTQEQLGLAVGVTKSSVSAWENNRETPSFHLLPRLRETLRMSLDELVIGQCAPRAQAGLAYQVREPAPEWPTSDIARNQLERAALQRLRGLSKAKQAAVVELLGLQMLMAN